MPPATAPPTASTAATNPLPCVPRPLAAPEGVAEADIADAEDACDIVAVMDADMEADMVADAIEEADDPEADDPLLSFALAIIPPDTADGSELMADLAAD